MDFVLTRVWLNGSRSHSHRGRRDGTRGAAVVEMALVLPLFLMLLFGIIEFGWIFMVSHALTGAAREGCRTATLAGATDAQIAGKVDRFMQGARISASTYELVITHATAVDPTEVVIVKVPYSRVSLLGSFFGVRDFYLEGYAAMRKEGM